MPTAGTLSLVDLARYPPLGRHLVEAHLETLRALPLIFVALLLRQASAYDWQFPAERAELDAQLKLLAGARDARMQAALDQFGALPLSPELLHSHWAAEPEHFIERLTAYLWTVHAMDAFRAAAQAYGGLTVSPSAKSPVPRLCLVLLGAGAFATGVPTPQVKLLERLRPFGTTFAQVDTTDALSQAFQAVRERAKQNPGPYRHWYVEGGKPLPPSAPRAELATVSYEALLPLRQALLAKVHTARVSGTVGPEDLRSMLAEMKPADFAPRTGAPGQADPVLERFQLEVLTEGSGTQIFSTTFVQWTARELLRRARPDTLLVRYGLRQKERPMDDLLLASSGPEALDPRGSLIDADMGAFYTWINLQRLPGAETNRFVVCVEGGQQAFAFGPGMAHGAQSKEPCTLAQILRWLG